MNTNLELNTEVTLGNLITNAKAIKENVSKEMEKYNNNVYLDISEAKADKAYLNKAAKALNDKRIEIEKEWNKPFSEFKNTIKEITTMIKESVAKINEVVAAAEEKRRAEKKEEVSQLFHEKGADKYFDILFQDRYLNKSVSIAEIEGELLTRLTKIHDELKAIKVMPDAAAIKEFYLEDLNLTNAIEKNRVYQEREFRIKQAKEQVTPNFSNNPECWKDDSADNELIDEYTIATLLTHSQLNLLKDFMYKNNIAYKVCKIDADEIH